MGETPEIDPYAAPAAEFQPARRRSRPSSVVWRALAWGAVAPLLLVAVGFCAQWPALFAVLLVAFFAAPAIWLHWSDFREGGVRSVSTARFLAAVIGGALAASAGAVLYLVLAGVYYWLF
jgi:hypothetical protein